MAANKALAAGEGVDDAVVLEEVCFFLQNVDVDLLLAPDSKDLCTSLSTQRNLIDR